MFDSNGMLTDRARGILFWITLSLIAIVAIAAIIAIVNVIGGLLSQEEPSLAINPGVVTLCIGEQRQFTVAGGAAVTWQASGGSITQGGLFTAGDIPGDHTVAASGADSRQTAQATVHVVICTPTPTLVPSPTPTPPATPTPESVAAADPQGDVGTYESGTPVEGVPAGVDISAASLGPDLRVTLQPTEGIPAGLAGWASEGEALLWIALHEPVASPPTVYINWLFALDLDGNPATGRPAGTARINPDLGDEAVLGVTYDPATGSYEPYFLIWDSAQQLWVAGAEGIRYTISDSRTVIGLALPLEALTQSAAQTTGVAFAPEAAKGRAAVDSYAGEQRVIDFYPDRP
jgi:hypothetical protein